MPERLLQEEREKLPVVLGVGEPPTPLPAEALAPNEPVTERLPLGEWLRVSVCVGYGLLEGVEDAEGEPPPPPPPGVALGLAENLPLLEAGGVSVTGEADAE